MNAKSPYMQVKKLKVPYHDSSRASRSLPRPADSYVSPLRGGGETGELAAIFGFGLGSLLESNLPDFVHPRSSTRQDGALYAWEAPAQDARSVESVATRFENLCAEWKVETKFMSSGEERFMHFAYQRIIGLGREGLPYILRELRDRPSHWFWALAAIAGEDHAAGSETFDEARERWLAWGAREGYLP